MSIAGTGSGQTSSKRQELFIQSVEMGNKIQKAHYVLKIVFISFVKSIYVWKNMLKWKTVKWQKGVSRMTLKPIDICWISTGYQPYWKIIHSIVLQTIVHEY